MRIKKSVIRNQITRYRGNLSTVARSVGRSRSWLYLYLEKHPDLWDTVNEARETMLDNAESMLYTKVLAGSTPELLFFLKTQGKRRGYVEKQQVEHSGGLEISRKLETLSDEEIEQLADIAKRLEGD